MPKKRVSELAKELGLASKDLIAHLEKIGITVFNVVGALVKKTEDMLPAKTIRLDVSGLVAGTYFIKIASQKGSCIKKVMVLN